MLPPALHSILLSQLQAALAMLDHCIADCPPEHWRSPIAKYPFWLVVYHTLYCTDGYLVRNEQDWKPHPTFHPGGQSDIDDEYPSREFTQAEIAAYAAHVRANTIRALNAETAESLAGPSGFARLPFTRAELHLYNLRHIQHHTGQLSAFLHSRSIPVRWVKQGAGPAQSRGPSHTG